MANPTLFHLPNVPEEFGVILEPSQLRTLNFSALDFETLRRVLTEYIASYFPDRFNDFVTNNGVIMFLEMVAYLGGNLSQRADILNLEDFFSTCLTEDSARNHMLLINQRFRRQTPAVADIEISIAQAAPTAINVTAGQSISFTGPDGSPVFYEFYRAPGDFTSSITIPPGKRGVIAHGIEGRFASDITVQSAGGPRQQIEIIDTNVLDDPIIVTVTTGITSIEYRRVQNIERAIATDEVYEVRFNEAGGLIIFGDNVAGKQPLAGSVITVRYRIGGGIRGRIGSLQIDETRTLNADPPSSAPVGVLFRNNSPSSGGQDKETLAAAKRRAPLEAATLGSAVSGEDYAQLASNFSHPVFGAVLKAVAAIRTGVESDQLDLVRRIRSATTEDEAVEILDSNFINRNIVELYILAEGPDRVPVLPSAGLRQGLVTYFDSINVLTDEIRVYSGAIKRVDLDINVQISRTADAATVRETVDVAVNSFFSVDNFDMGQPFYLSNLYETIQATPGVTAVTIFTPSDDIIPTRKLADPTSAGVGINELIQLGQANIDYYFSRAR